MSAPFRAMLLTLMLLASAGAGIAFHEGRTGEGVAFLIAVVILGLGAAR